MPNRLLDTSALAPHEREAAAREFLETITEVDVVGHGCPAESVRTRVRSWDLHKFQLNVMGSPWLRFGLNRRSTTEAVSFGTQLSGQTIKTIGAHRQAFAPGEMSLTDFASPFQWWSAEPSTHPLIRAVLARWTPTDFVVTYIMPLAPLLCQFRARTRMATDTLALSVSASGCSTPRCTRRLPASHARHFSKRAGG